MKIGTHEIGPGHEPFVIAEISGEHRGDGERLFKLLRAAKDAGASAVKLQCFDPSALAASRGGADKRLTEGPWAGMTLGEIYAKTQTSRALLHAASKWCWANSMTWFASAFSEEDVDFLVALDSAAIKIASFELRNLSLVRKAHRTGKPNILSTGMGSDDDIKTALPIEFQYSRPVAILHCVSSYPCPVSEANLGRLHQLKYIHYNVGFSDHTLGPECAIAAVALGASIIEKHITLDRNDGGLDASFSMEPAEFKSMVQAIRNVHLALQPPKGDGEAIYRGLRSNGN